MHPRPSDAMRWSLHVDDGGYVRARARFICFEKVEINNTDAEGRLVLSDGVAYAVRHLEPSVIVDVATLTGAQGVATGRRHAAVMSNDEGLERLAVTCGRSTGDLVHPVIYCPEFFSEEFRCAVPCVHRYGQRVSCTIGSGCP